MKIGIASDHRGYKLKNEIINKLKEKYDVLDYGSNNGEAVDYPKYAFKIGEEIINRKIKFGILICGSGIGISIAANKVKGIRCAVIKNKEDSILSRCDNNANIISLPENMNKEECIELIDAFINEPFSKEERHIRRVKQIEEYENNVC